MDLVSLKKLKLFKGQAALPPKNHGANGLKEKKPPIVQRVVRNPFVLLVVFALVLSYIIAYRPTKSLPLPKEGDIADSDITAPMDLTIEDEEASEANRARAREAVLPVYIFNHDASLSTEARVRQFFADGRAWLKAGPAQSGKLEQLQASVREKFDIEVEQGDLALLVQYNFAPGLEEALASVLNGVLARGVLASKSLFVHREAERGLTLVRAQDERTVQVADILDQHEAEAQVAAAVDVLQFSRRQKALLTGLAAVFLSPNITFDQAGTEARLERAAARVELVYYRVKKGKVIIRKGDEVTADGLRQIRLVNTNLQAAPYWFLNFLGTFLFLGMVFLTLWYLLRWILGTAVALTQLAMMGLVLLLSLLVYKLGLLLAQLFSQNTSFELFAHPESYPFAFPFQFGVLIFAFLATVPVSLIYAILNSLLVGYLLRADFYMMIFCLLGGLAAIYGVKLFQRQKRTTILRAGLFLVAPVNVFVVVTILLARGGGGPLGVFSSELFMSVLGGLIGAAIAFVLLPVAENIFGFITPTKLLELTTSETPTLKQLALEAPGSYHHSLLVAALAEKAAEAIKLDPLLVKAGALYHDIGKLKRPEYFIENRARNVDAHKTLTPTMSALVIINHVKDGVEMARKLRLPRVLREIIEQHHGNTVVRYFFQKAKEKYNPEMHKIEEEHYRYPGPVPQTKEAALILLADSVEAASKSIRTPSEANFKRVIAAIFDNHIQDGQLDDCHFSLKELKAVASSFLETLESIFRPRVEYPGFDFEGKPDAEREEKTNGHDRDPQPPDQTPDQ